MFKEIAAALGGVTLALAAFVFVLLYPGVSSPNTMASTQHSGLLPIVVPLSGATDQRLYFSGAIGVYPGILPAFILSLVALGIGILVARLAGARLNRDDYLDE